MLQVFGFSGCVWLGFPAAGQTLLWHGHPASWEASSDSAHTLTLSAPGSAWLYTCPPNTAGSTVRVRWSTTFSGSQNNFSAVHLFNLPPGVNPGDPSLANGPPPAWTFHIGAPGADDGLEVTSPDGVQVMHFNGDLAGPVDLALRWGGPPGGPQVTLAASLDPAGGWPLIPVDTLEVGPSAQPPDCIGWSATVTTSNLQGVHFALDEWAEWTADTVPPVVLGVHLVAPDTAIWTTNEPLADNELSHQIRQPLDSPAIAGVPMWLPSPAMADLAGNAMATGTDSGRVAWTDPGLHGPGHVVFSEILVDPTPSDWLPAVEWVEVVNASDLAVQIADLQWFDTGSGLSAIQPLSPWDGQLLPGDRALLTTSSQPLFAGIRQAFLPDGGSLSDYGDEIGLLCPDSPENDLEWSDRVAWDNENWDSNGRNGRSWQRRYLGGCSGPANWRASGAPLGATPGAPGWFESEGPGPEPGNSQASVSLPRSPVEVEVQFMEPLDPWALEHLPAGISGQATGPDSKWLALRRSTSPATGNKISGLQWCFGTNRNVAWQWPETEFQFAEPGDVVITEILAEPLAGSPGAPQEWVELHNLRNDTIELTGLRINDHLPAERWHVGPDCRVTFHFPGPHDLPNTSGDVVLSTSSRETVDSVRYTPCFFSRKSHISKGMSVVRTAAGWSTSGAPSGASPGAVDPAETTAAPSESSPVSWMLCGRTEPEHQAVALFNRPVEHLAIAGLDIRPLSALLDGRRAWVLDWPASAVPWPDLMVHLSETDSVLLPPPAGCGQVPAEWTDVQLSEVLSDTDVEPFVEIRPLDNPIVSSNFALSAADDPLHPAHRFPFSDGGVTWFLPAQSTWAFATCPNRLHTPNALPFSDMPSLWGEPRISLLGETAGDWILVDSVVLGDHRHADWVRDAHEISLERCGPSHWTSCRHVAGHTAGSDNSTENWCGNSAEAEATAQLTPPIWWPGGPPLQIVWSSKSTDCTPSATIRDGWSLRAIQDLGNPMPVSSLQPKLTWMWEGATQYGSGVPPAGRYLVHLSGCSDRFTMDRWLPFVIRSP